MSADVGKLGSALERRKNCQHVVMHDPDNYPNVPTWLHCELNTDLGVWDDEIVSKA